MRSSPPSRASSPCCRTAGPTASTSRCGWGPHRAGGRERRALYGSRRAPGGSNRRCRSRRTDPRLQATQTLLEDEEEDLHVFLRDLGEQRLKDLERPVRLYQAGAEGSPAPVPADPARGRAGAGDRGSTPTAAVAAPTSTRRRSRGSAPRRARGCSSRHGIRAGPERRASQSRRSNRSGDERDRGRGAGWHPSWPDRGRRRIGLGRQPRGPDDDEDRSGRTGRGGDGVARRSDTDGNRGGSRRGLGGAWPSWPALQGRSSVRPGDAVDRRCRHCVRLPQRKRRVGAGTVWVAFGIRHWPESTGRESS